MRQPNEERWSVCGTGGYWIWILSFGATLEKQTSLFIMMISIALLFGGIILLRIEYTPRRLHTRHEHVLDCASRAARGDIFIFEEISHQEDRGLWFIRIEWHFKLLLNGKCQIFGFSDVPFFPHTRSFSDIAIIAQFPYRSYLHIFARKARRRRITFDSICTRGKMWPRLSILWGTNRGRTVYVSVCVCHFSSAHFPLFYKRFGLADWSPGSTDLYWFMVDALTGNYNIIGFMKYACWLESSWVVFCVRWR